MRVYPNNALSSTDHIGAGAGGRAQHDLPAGVNVRAHDRHGPIGIAAGDGLDQIE